MKVFLTGSGITNGRAATVRRILVKRKHKVLFAATADKNRSSGEIFRSVKDQIDQADCVIAEVTDSAIDVGGQIVYALVQGVPVLALFYRDAENRLSPMIEGNPSDNLFIEHYDDDNLGIVMRNFLAQVNVGKRRKGSLIVIDGGDGSGKATQSELLAEKLRESGQRVKMMDFPRYYSSFHGRVVGRFLSGEFGSLESVSPYLAALAYALDRATAKEEMDQWLTRGGVIVSNRYATSNMAHQAARLPQGKRKEFIDWIDELEYKVHRIPREDVVVYLYVPWKIGYALTLKKNSRAYIKGALDIAEKDMGHRQEAEKMYLSLARSRKNWVKIDCTQGDAILPKDVIHKRIIDALVKRSIPGVRPL